MGSLDAQSRRAFKQIFEYLLANLRLGRPEPKERSENFQMYAYEATTPSTANAEFEIVHGLGKAPYLLIPIIPLDTPGAKIVRLEVSKAADSNRVYLKSPDTDAPIRVFIEG